MDLQLTNVTKRFGEKLAVDAVSLTLTPGVWGLLGANGAGKTTLMHMIAGIMRPTAGSICYDGVPIDILGEGYRASFGYLPQEFGFYPEFTVKDYLVYMAALKGLTRQLAVSRIEMLLERLSLTEVYTKRIIKLSGGMKRRVGIAQALLNEPRLLVLDEPTSGLDPAERVRFRNLLSAFAVDRTVLISTHIVPDVEYCAAKNAVMRGGRIIAIGSTAELVKQVEGQVFQGSLSPEDFQRRGEGLNIVNLKNEVDGRISLRYIASTPQTEDSVAVAPRLEDLYLHLFPQETAR